MFYIRMGEISTFLRIFTFLLLSQMMWGWRGATSSETNRDVSEESISGHGRTDYSVDPKTRDTGASHGGTEGTVNVN